MYVLLPLACHAASASGTSSKNSPCSSPCSYPTLQMWPCTSFPPKSEFQGFCQLNSSNQKPTCSYGGPQKNSSTVAVAAAAAMGEGENCRNHHLQLLQRGNFTVSFDHRLDILLKSWNNSFHPCIIWWDEHCFCKSLFQIFCHLTLPQVGCLLFVLLPKALLSLQLFHHHCCHVRGAPCFLSNHHNGCNEKGYPALSPQGLSPKYPHSFWWISTKTLNPKPLTLWRTHDIASVGATTRTRSTKHTQPSRGKS